MSKSPEAEAKETNPDVPSPSWRPRLATVIKLIVIAAIVVGAAYLLLFRPAKVHVHTVVKAEVVREIYGRGTIESQRETQLGFDMVGRLSELLVDEGDEVVLGQELAKLYTESIDAEVKTARSSVSAARASLGRLAAEERKARETLKFAQREEIRVRGLVEASVSAAAELDGAVQASRIARAELDRVLGARREATRGVDVASGGVAQRKASALRATLLAPFDGVVVRTFREPGDTVSVGSTVVRVVDSNTLIVRSWIDETALADLAEGQATRITLAGRSESYLGTLSRIGREVDRKTHELLVEISLSTVPPHIAVGQRAEVYVEVERKSDVVVIPLAFLLRDDKGLHALVDEGGKTKRIAIEIGISSQKHVEVTSGLQADDVVLRPAKEGKTLSSGKRWTEGSP